MADLPNLANVDYVARVNRAIDHITRNLADPLRLDDVARVACFSPYHFHRIFRALTGETLNVFVKRVRLERAVYLLSHRQGASLTEIAFACGFSSSSDFSRNFRSHFGVAPRTFDVAKYRDAKRGQLVALVGPDEPQFLTRLPVGENPDGFVVNLVNVPARSVAYIRVVRSFEPGNATAAVERLVAWARARDLVDGQWLGYMWEDPEIVALDKCRYDVGVEVPADTPVGGEVGLVRFPPMRLAEIDIAGPIELVQRALDWLYGTWLPTSGFAPAHQPGFEAWNGEPFAHGDTYFEIRAQLAVVDLATPLS